MDVGDDEFDDTLLSRWPFAERHPDGTYRLPPDLPVMPLVCSLRASKDR